MESAVFLRNHLYVAAWHDEIGRSLTARTLLGDKVVLYRREDGSVVALEDACCHRKMPLSMGRLDGDHLQCAYHGMTYDGSGRCVRIPGQERIPEKARVRSYPVHERWGWVFLWMGEPEKADSGLLPDVPEFGAPGWTMNRGPVMRIESQAGWVIDNLLDPSHTTFVHPTTLGVPEGADVPITVRETDGRIAAVKWTLDLPPAGLFRKFGSFAGKVDRWQIYEFSLPSLVIVDLGSADAGSGAPEDGGANRIEMRSFNFVTPETEQTSLYHWFQIRNFAPDDETVSAALTATFTDAFEEDLVVLKAIHAAQARSSTPNLDIASDAAPMRVRRMLQKLIDREQGAASAAA